MNANLAVLLIMAVALVVVGGFLARDQIARRSEKRRRETLETDRVVSIDVRKSTDEQLRDQLRRDRGP